MPDIPDLDFIRSVPNFGPRMYEALQAIVQNQQIIAQQTNSTITGAPPAPPAPNSLTVSAQNGHFQVAIADNNDGLYRGVSYHVEHADNPQFTNSQTEHLGPTRNANLFLGNVTRYFRAYSSYSASGISSPVYHGSSLSPTAVTGGGDNGGPAFLPSQGSGTGKAGQPLSGPGPVPFRSKTGKAPLR